MVKRLTDALGARGSGAIILVFVVLSLYLFYELTRLEVAVDGYLRLYFVMAPIAYLGYYLVFGKPEVHVAILLAILLAGAGKTAQAVIISISKRTGKTIPIVHVAPALPETWEEVSRDSEVLRRLNKDVFSVLLGYNERGPLIVQLTDLHNLIICGPVGTGKTVLLRQIVASLLLKPAIRDRLKFVFIDLKRNLGVFAPAGKYVVTVEQALEEFHRQRVRLGETNARREKENVDWWYELKNPPQPTLIVFDETQQMLEHAGPDFGRGFGLLTNTGREAGFITVTTALYPRDDLFPIKWLSNFHGRISARQTLEYAYNSLFGQGWYAQNQKLCDLLDQTGQFIFDDGRQRPFAFNSYMIERAELAKLAGQVALDFRNEYHLLYEFFHKNHGASSEWLAKQLRDYYEQRQPGGNWRWLHEKAILEMLAHFTQAGIADYQGPRHPYVPKVTDPAQFVRLWDEYVDGGGLKTQPDSEAGLVGSRQQRTTVVAVVNSRAQGLLTDAKR